MTRMDPVKETWMFNMVTHTDEHRRRSNVDPEDASRVLSPRTRTRFGDRAHLHAHNAATNPVQVSVELQSHVRAAKTDSQEKSRKLLVDVTDWSEMTNCHCFKKEHLDNSSLFSHHFHILRYEQSLCSVHVNTPVMF